MTQIELFDYMKDIEDEIEDISERIQCEVKENLNGYGCHIHVTSNDNKPLNGEGVNVIQIISERIELLFDLDHELEFISGRSLIIDSDYWEDTAVKRNIVKIQPFDHNEWVEFSRSLTDTRLMDLMINIGKLPRRIKKFESFK